MSMNLYLRAVNDQRIVQGPELTQTPTGVTYSILKLDTLEEQLQAYFDYYEKSYYREYLTDEEYREEHNRSYQDLMEYSSPSLTYEKYSEMVPCPTAESEFKRDSENVESHKKSVKSFIDDWSRDSVVEFYAM